MRPAVSSRFPYPTHHGRGLAASVGPASEGRSPGENVRRASGPAQSPEIVPKWRSRWGLWAARARSASTPTSGPAPAAVSPAESRGSRGTCLRQSGMVFLLSNHGSYPPGKVSAQGAASQTSQKIRERLTPASSH